jgi:hypothetical protein
VSPEADAGISSLQGDAGAGASETRDSTCEATISAPIDSVRRLLVDYADYATTLPNFGRSRVLRRTPEGTDVYLQVPILRGAANLWGVVRFVGPKSAADGELIEGKYLREGNVSAFHCLWRYRAVDASHTAVKLDLLLLPPFPLPESMIRSELDSACRDAVEGVKVHAEARQPAGK